MTAPLKTDLLGVTPVPVTSWRTPVFSGNRTTDWLNVVLGPILNRARGAEARQLAIAGDRSVIPLVYGEDRVGGLIANIVPSGANVLVQIVWALAGDSVNDIKYNDRDLPTGASATSYDGSQVTADSGLAAAFSAQSITYSETLNGYMYSVVTMPQSEFTGSLQFSARIKGRKVYDPRTLTTAWSDNPALHLRDFLENTSYGCGKTVDSASTSTVANACDALVGGSEKRRLSGLSFIGTYQVTEIAEILRAHAGCFTVPSSSGIKLVTDAARTTDATYSHASGEIARLVRVSKKDVGNVPTAVEVVYTNASVFPWKDDYAVAEASGIDVTVPRRTSQVRMPGVQRYSQAKREAIERLNKLRTSDLEVVLEVFDKGIAHEVGDVIEVTHPVGLSSKKLRIADPEMIGANLWRLTCLEYDPAAYSDDVSSAPTYADTNLINQTWPAGGVFNLVKNADFTASLGAAYDYPNARYDTVAVPGWNYGYNQSASAALYRNFNNGASYNVGAGGVLMSSGTRGTGTATSAYWCLQSDLIGVSSGQTLEASVYANPYNCGVELTIAFYNTGGTYTTGATLGQFTSTGGSATYLGDPYSPQDWPRLFQYGTAPANGYARVMLYKYATLTTGTADFSAVAWHKVQLCKWGGGTNAQGALPWAPFTGVGSGGVNTGNIGQNAATEVYTAQSSGTGHARFDTSVLGGTHVTQFFDQTCSVSMQVSSGDKLGIYAAFVGDKGNTDAIYDYTKLAIDVYVGTGTVWHTDSLDKTGNYVSVTVGAGSNASARAKTLDSVYLVAADGTATVYAGGGCLAGLSTSYTESGASMLRVERIKR